MSGKPYPPDVREAALELRERGRTTRQIAAALGMCSATVSRWMNPEKHRRPCPLCGRLMASDAAGRDAPSRVCRGCAPTTYVKWTDEAIIEAIREWTRLYGRSPSAADWNPSLAESLGLDERAARFRDDDRWPGASTVRNRFGSWNDALRAAGVPWRVSGLHIGKEEVS